MYVVTIHQRYRQTDRQTDDIGYDSNNVLRAVKTVSVSRKQTGKQLPTSVYETGNNWTVHAYIGTCMFKVLIH